VKVLGAYITGSGMFVPERSVSNEEIAGRLGLNAEQIFKSSGIRSRRWVAPGTTTSSLALAALQPALEDAGLAAADVDYLLFGTMTPDRFIPGSAAALQQLAGLRQIPCLDIRATCCNALYGIQLARALVESGQARHVAVCLAEVQSPWLDLSPESGTTSMLFGDGASALIVSSIKNSDSLRVVDVLLSTDGNFVDDLGIRRPGTQFGSDCEDGQHAKDFRPRMTGQTVIMQAARKMPAACLSVLRRNNLTITDVRWIVPHQANANLLNKVALTLGFPPDDGGLVSVIGEFGNTSSASMGIALDTLRRARRIQPGEYLLLPAFGAGFTWGAALCRHV
jgi:3-oxoacyl-[acyl-carrier-protein] synthase-3